MAVVGSVVSSWITDEEREIWDNRAQFILSLMGFAVGLGNVWRFPYLTQKNGGGAFLVPYLVMLLIEGIPLFYLELAVGQRLRKGSIGVWNQVSPYIGGLGVTAAIVSIYLCLYYNTIMSWCLVYIVQSFQSPLPWASCPEDKRNNGSIIVVEECERSSPPSYFWYRSTLNQALNVDSVSDFNLKIALGLVVAWFMVFLCLMKGIKSSGKVVYVTALFPYLILVIFFIRGLTLEGFDKGLEILFVPKWIKLIEPQVWLDAATQIFFSLSLSFGGLIAMASYNPVTGSILTDTLVVTFSDFFTSIFASAVVFSVLGFRATLKYKNCVENYKIKAKKLIFQSLEVQCNFRKIMDQSGSGTGLAFITFTEAINQFPLAPLWAVMFFLMLLTLGIDSLFGTLEGAITSFNDLSFIPRIRKDVFCGAICTSCLTFSMIFATSTGPYAFALFDSFSCNIPLLVIGFSESVAVAYIYGLKRISDDIELMIGKRPSYFWLICWRYVTPLALFFIFVSSIVDIIQHGMNYEIWDPDTGTAIILPWPDWCTIVGWLLILGSVIWIPGVAFTRLIGIKLFRDRNPCAFPTEELTIERGIVAHQITSFERIVFGFKE